MSDYPPTPSFGASYGYPDQTKPPYLQSSYPNQYLQPDGGHPGRTSMSLAYETTIPAYGYNQALPNFSAATTVASGVPPLPIFQGWSQDPIPLPSYTSPLNGMPYSGYTGNSHHNTQSFPPVDQQSYQHHAQTARPLNVSELSDGEYEDGLAPKNPTPVDHGSTQYRVNDGTGYIDSANRALYARSQNYSPLPSSRIGNDLGYTREAPQMRRHLSDSYSPYASQGEIDLEEHSKKAQPYTTNPASHGPDYINGAMHIQGQPSWTRKDGTPLQSDSHVNGFSSHMSIRDPLEQTFSTVPPVHNPADTPTTYKSVSEARKKAQGAILRLLPYEVRFQNYIDEGIDETLVERLFDDLGMPRAPSKSSNEMHLFQNHSEKQDSAVNIYQTSKSRENIKAVPSKGNALFGGQSPAAGVRPPSGKEPLLRNINDKQLPLAVHPPSPTSISPSATTTIAQSKATVTTEKERTLQMKMEALRKSREERAQKAAAKNSLKSLTGEIQATQAAPSTVAKPTTSPSVLPLPTSQPQAVKPPVSSPTQLQGASQQQVPAIPGLFRTSTAANPAPSITSHNTMNTSTPANQRKRPVAADFDGPSTTLTLFKRPFGQSREERPLVIDVSDEEAESDEEDVAMDIESQADQESPVQAARKLSDHRTVAIQNLPSLSDFPARKPFTPPPNPATNTPPKSQVTSKVALSRPEDLQRKESEIEQLKKRIAEAERRNKARQSSSGTHTPRSLDANSNDGKANSNSNIASKVEASIQMQRMIVIAENKISSDQQMLAEAQASELDKAAELKRNETERKRLRREKIANDLPLVDAEVQQNRMKLEQLRVEMTKMEAVVQKNLEDKQRLAEEMEKLVQEVEDQVQTHKEKLEDMEREEKANGDHAASDPPRSLNVEPGANRTSPSSTGEQLSPSISTEPTPSAAKPELLFVETDKEPSIATPASAQSVDNSHLIVHNPASSTSVESQPGIDTTQSRQLCKAELQEVVQADADSDAVGTEDVDMEASQALEPKQISQMPNSSPLESDRRGLVYSPVLDRTIPDILDGESDNYEPPEATPPVDVEPPKESSPFTPGPPGSVPESGPGSSAENTTVPVQAADLKGQDGIVGLLPTRQNAIAPQAAQNGTTNYSNETQYFTPYESPLKIFRAYRYHKEFKQQVPGGLKSLTYSHKIDSNKEFCRYELAEGTCNDSACEFQHFRDMGLPDDAVLTALGSPDEFTGEQRTRFCDGLKAILSDLRLRKVRDFDIIASEIVAHRSKFLGDDSKVLMLEEASV